MRLHVGEAAAEQSLGALASQVLDLIVPLAAAVVALARIALGVLVGHPAAGGVHDHGADVVLAGDELKRRLLAVTLAREDGRHLRIVAAEHVEQGGSHGIGGVGHGGHGGGWRHDLIVARSLVCSARETMASGPR